MLHESIMASLTSMDRQLTTCTWWDSWTRQIRQNKWNNVYVGKYYGFIILTSPGFVEMCTLKKSKHRRSWLVQLATRTKEKVSEVVRECPLVMNGQVTYEDLNVLPPGSYDILIGIYRLESHRAKLDCYNKTFA